MVVLQISDFVKGGIGGLLLAGCGQGLVGKGPRKITQGEERELLGGTRVKIQVGPRGKILNAAYLVEGAEGEEVVGEHLEGGQHREIINVIIKSQA